MTPRFQELYEGARNAGNRYDLVVAGMILIGLIGVGLDYLRLPGVR